MINKINVDVQIYIEKLIEGINQIGLIENLAVEWGIKDEKEFENVFKENLTLTSSLAYEENNDPTLTEDQFEKALVRSLTEYTVDTLVEDGSLIVDLDQEKGENVYMLSPEKKDLSDGTKNEQQ